MPSSLTTCSSTEDEFSADVFGQGGNEVNDGGTTSVSADVNSRKTAIGDGGMKRKMTELFILTVVNITVTVALINFIAPNENARINSELESLKKFVGKMEQQRGNNGVQQTEFYAKMNTEKNMVKAIETKLNELVEQQKKEAIFIGVLKDRFGNEKEMPTNEAGEEKLSQLQNDQKKLLKKISEMEKQSKVSGDQLSKSQNDQKKLLKKISEMEKQQRKQTKVEKMILCILSPLLVILRHGSDSILYLVLNILYILCHMGAFDILHLVLNIVLNILCRIILWNIFGGPKIHAKLLGCVPSIIHALWYCFFS